MDVAFTSKDHNFLPGETVEKQIVVINNSRETVTCKVGWSFDLPQSVTDIRQLTVATGDQARIPLRFELPNGLATGSYEIHLTAKFGTGETQEDRFVIDVSSPVAPTVARRSLTPSLSAIGGERARQTAEKRRLSSAIWTNNTDNLPGPHFHVNVLYCRKTSKTLGDTFQQ